MVGEEVVISLRARSNPGIAGVGTSLGLIPCCSGAVLVEEDLRDAGGLF